MKINKLALTIATLCLTACASSKGPVTPTFQANDIASEITQIYDFVPPQNLKLNEVMAYVLTRNQDMATKRHEKSIAEGDKIFASLDYLPQITATLDNRERDRLNLSTSARLGEAPIEGVDTTPSFSAPLEVQNRTLSARWDLLNIIENYLVNVPKKKNAIYIAQLNREKAAQNVFRDVHSAFYLTAIYQTEGVALISLRNKLKNNLNEICEPILESEVMDDVLATRCTSGLETLNNVDNLIQKLQAAEINLAALMRVSPDVQISLATPDFSDPGYIDVDVEGLVDVALANRPEIAIEIIKERNAKLDKRGAYLDILPSLEFGYSYNETDNPFIVNSEWEEESVALTWNIIGKAIGAPFQAKAANRRGLLANSRKRAFALVAITQTHLAHQRYVGSRETWINTHRQMRIETRRSEKQEALFANGQLSEVVYLTDRINKIFATVKAKASHVEMTDSIAQLMLSIGVPVTPSVDSSRSFDELARKIEKQLQALSILEGYARVPVGPSRIYANSPS